VGPLAWADVVPIPGTKRRKWLRENIAADDIDLSDADVAALEAAIRATPSPAIVTSRPVCATSTPDLQHPVDEFDDSSHQS